jgi:hypothetical protein
VYNYSITLTEDDIIMKVSQQPKHVIENDGTQQWYQNGQLHREDGPAIILADGGERWYLNGQLHRTSGPSLTDDEVTAWYYHGLMHREGGPAVIYHSTGYEMWYQNGKLHRTDGPAEIFDDGTIVWWLNHNKFKFIDWLNAVPMSEQEKTFLILKWS